MKSFDELTPELQEVVTNATVQLNARAHPSPPQIYVFPILKPFNYSEAFSVEAVGYYKAHFVLGKQTGEHMGRYLFQGLEE